MIEVALLTTVINYAVCNCNNVYFNTTAFYCTAVWWFDKHACLFVLHDLLGCVLSAKPPQAIPS